jgi:hypothetical protein
MSSGPCVSEELPPAEIVATQSIRFELERVQNANGQPQVSAVFSSHIDLGILVVYFFIAPMIGDWLNFVPFAPKPSIWILVVADPVQG